MNKPPTQLPESELLEHLASGDPDKRKRALAQLFRDKDLRNKVYKYLFQHGADGNDAAEVFQFALETFDRKVRMGEFEGRSQVHTYFIGIVKWHWLNEQRKRGRQVEFKGDTQLAGDGVPAVDAGVLDEEREQVLYEAIAQLGERCRQLLPLWAQNVSPEQLCAQFGFSSPEMAKKETYRCRQKLKEFVDARPALRDSLKFW